MITFIPVGRGPVRVSLVAAPKDPFPMPQMGVELRPHDDPGSDTSSRCSTVFNYPWDLPPPNLTPKNQDEPSTGGPSTNLTTWTTLHTHLSHMNNSTIGEENASSSKNSSPIVSASEECTLSAAPEPKPEKGKMEVTLKPKLTMRGYMLRIPPNVNLLT